MANDLQTTNSKTPMSSPLLDEKLNELLLSGASPVIGPQSAAVLREYAAIPEPPLATQAQVETMIGKLAIATAQPKVSQQEADARVELYWLALRDIALVDLRAGFLELVQTATFLPTPAEVRKAATLPGQRRRYLKSRARYLAWLHEKEWRPKPDRIADASEVRAILASHG